MYEVALLVNLPPTCIVDIPQSRRIRHSFHLGRIQSLSVVQFLHDGALLKKIILILKYLLIIPVFFPIAADVAYTPELLTKWLIIKVVFPLFI